MIHHQEVIDRGDQVALYSPITGRWLTLDRETWASSAGNPALAARLDRLGLRTDPDPLALVPCHSRRVLLLPDRPALWAPDPWRPTAGGPAYRAIPLSPAALRLWSACNGSRTLAAVADRAGIGADEAIRIVAGWTDLAVQALQLRPNPTPPHDPGLLVLLGAIRPPSARTATQYDPSGATALGAWHHDIADPATHFDDVETTIAHTFRRPTPALGGQPYGIRLRERLRQAGAPVDGPILELGPGTGDLAAAWGSSFYTRVDRSPALLQAQQRAAPSTRGILADALRLPLRDRSVPLVLCNEVIADLPAVPASANHPAVEERIRRYGLPRAPDGAFHNLGAWCLVEELARILAPGGQAVLTEFGDPTDAATEAVQLDHPEVSIQFDPLVTIARAHGLRAELHRLDDWLGIDLGCRQIARHSWFGLRALLGLSPGAVWTPAELAAAADERIDGVEWVTLAEEGPGPLVTRFYALVLTRADGGPGPA